MPTFYSFHPITKAFVGSGEAQASPAEVGIFLLPASSTFKVPPTYNPTTQTVVFNGTNWTVIAKPVEIIEAVVFGWLATPEEKLQTFRNWANDQLNNAAKALGFVSILDAVAMAPGGDPANQMESDAKVLKDWRSAMLSAIDAMAIPYQGNTNPMPLVQDIIAALPKFNRIVLPPVIGAAGAVHDPVTLPAITTLPTPISLNELLGLPNPPEPPIIDH